MNILIAFMYIFGFKISIIDSTIVVGIILSIYMLCNRRYLNIFLKKMINKNTVIVILLFILLIFWSLVTTELQYTQDLSYIKVLLHLLTVIIIGYELVAYYELKKVNNEIVNYIIISFIIQSVFQWIFFIFPNISQYFNIFRTQGMIERSIQYSGYRGIAITTSGFFALSSSYAFVIVLYFTKYNTIFSNNNLLRYLFFVVLLSGTFFAGRTGFIGLIFVLLLYILRKRGKLKKNSFKKLFLIIFIFILSLSFINFTKDNKKFKNLYNFAFELIQNYENGKGFKSSSTSKLLNMYNIEFSTKTLIIGDGQYTMLNNHGVEAYYKNTDVGYYRKILYFGSIGLILSLILQYYIFGNMKNKKESIVLMLLLMVLELKGEIVGINIMINSIIILYSNILFIEEGKEENVRKSDSFNDNL